MSNKALNWARRLPLKPGEKSVLKALADSYNDKKECCYPKNEKIAKWCGYHKRTVTRHIQSLISKNIIQKEDVRNQLGHRVTSKYTLNFDLNLDSLSDNLSCGQLQSLSDNLSTLSDNLSIPKCQTVTKDYILNQSIKPKENKEISLLDNFNEQKIQTAIGIKFEQLRKIYGDSYDIENARRLHEKLCLENEHPLEFADNLVKARKQQIIDFKKLNKAGKFVQAPCSLTNWLKGKRWLDIIKSLGEKKKASPYVKCKSCGEEFLKGTSCRRCEELTKPRVAAYA